MKDVKTMQAECGLTLRLVPMSSAIIGLAEEKVKREMRAEGKAIDPPTYTLDVDGRKETHQHYVDIKRGRTTLDVPDDPGATRVNYILWAEHEQAQTDFELLMGEERIKLYLMFGCECTLPEDVSIWEAQMTYLGKMIPTHPLERKALYLATNLTSGELADALTEIQMLAAGNAIKQEDKELFRLRIRGQIGRNIRRALADTEDEERALDSRPAIPRDAHGEGVESDT